MHSDSLMHILDDLKARLELTGGLFPDDFTTEDITFLYEMGYQFYQTEQYQRAEEIFQRLVIAKPGESKFWQGYASSLQMLNNYKEALVPWSMCCIVDSENPLPHYHAAECLISIGEIAQGLQALKAAELRDTNGSFTDKIALYRDAWKNHGVTNES